MIALLFFKQKRGVLRLNSATSNKTLLFYYPGPLSSTSKPYCRDMMVTQVRINVTQKIPDTDSDFVDRKLVILVILLLAAGGLRANVNQASSPKHDLNIG